MHSIDPRQQCVVQDRVYYNTFGYTIHLQITSQQVKLYKNHTINSCIVNFSMLRYSCIHMKLYSTVRHMILLIYIKYRYTKFSIRPAITISHIFF
jgi:hypothetical protein